MFPGPDPERKYETFFFPRQQQPLRWTTVLSLLNTTALQLYITEMPSLLFKLEYKCGTNRCQCLYEKNIHRLIDNIGMVSGGNRILLRSDGNYK